MEIIYRETVRTAVVDKVIITNLDKENAEKIFSVLSRAIKRELAEEMHVIAMGSHVFCAAAPSKCVEREVFILEEGDNK